MRTQNMSNASQVGPNPDYGVLSIHWAAAITNKEGSDKGLGLGVFHHGPVGNFHILVYGSEMYSDLLGRPDRTGYPDPLFHRVLVGPTDNEWDDGDHKTYNPPFDAFQWRSASDSVALFIYESDPDRAITRRKHDGVFLAKVTRQSTIRKKPVFKSALRIGNRKADIKVLERATNFGRKNGLFRALTQKKAWTRPLSPGMPTSFVQCETLSGGRDKSYPRLYQRAVWGGKTLQVKRSIRDLKDQGFNDRTSSLTVPAGWVVTFYNDENFQGTSVTVRGPFTFRNLSKERPGGFKWNDRISSVRVVAAG